jgi:hypothetical protein
VRPRALRRGVREPALPDAGLAGKREDRSAL